MNISQLLLEHFDHLLTTPDAVERLNQAILDLAVRGKLVPQDPTDEPASELLKRIQAEKVRLVKAGEIGKSKPLPSIHAEEMPFALPKGWAWGRLEDIAQKLGAGSTPLGGKQVYEDTGVKFIRSQNVWNDGLRLDDVAYISEQINEKMSGSVVRAKDILLNITGASIARCALVPDDFDSGNVNQHVAIVRMIEPEVRGFIHTCMTSSYVYNLIMSVQVGVSREGLSMSRLCKFVLPLPPLAEQHRIVARVEQLFAQTRQLAVLLSKAQTGLTHLNAATLHHLLAADTPEDFNMRWDFIAAHFDLLYSEPEHIAPLRQAILELAVRGKLTRQAASDEPASELLKRIQTEKARLVEAGELRDSGPLPTVREDEKSFELPNGWEWARFAEVANIASNLVQPDLFPDMPHIAPNTIEKGTGKLLDYATVAEDEVRSANHRFFAGQLLYSKIRPNLSKAVVVDFEGLCSADMYPIDVFIATNYLLRFILSEAFLNIVTAKDTRVAMPKVNQVELNKVPIAVPPLAEQQRIVARVEQLLGLCDALEAKLQAAQTQREKLVGAVVAGVSEPSPGATRHPLPSRERERVTFSLIGRRPG